MAVCHPHAAACKTFQGSIYSITPRSLLLLLLTGLLDPDWERKQRLREYRVASRREKRNRKADEKKQRKLNATILRRMVGMMKCLGCSNAESLNTDQKSSQVL